MGFIDFILIVALFFWNVGGIGFIIGLFKGGR
jgi:hypothetical protein